MKLERWFLFGALLAGCVSEKLPIGAQCELTTDCTSPFVCRLERCRIECAGDRDCPLGAVCAVDQRGFGSCLLPDEDSCTTDAECPGGLGCAVSIDDVCRTECVDESVCLRSQACQASFCVDTMSSVEPRDGGIADGEATDADPCALPRFDCNEMESDGCEVDLSSDLSNCGECGNVCGDTASNAVPACIRSECGIACEPSFGDCNGIEADGCETPLARTEASCGECGDACGGDRVCIGGFCRAPAYPVEGPPPTMDLGPMMSDGGMDMDAGTPAETVIVLSPRRHYFRSIYIPVGTTLRVAPGEGTLELIATGDVEIAGTIDMRGGDGARPLSTGGSSGGGTTGTPIAGGTAAGCNAPGRGGSGTRGEAGPGAMSGCALGGDFGGGMSGLRDAGGGGGGGYGGGGGGGSPTGRGGSGGGASGGAGGLACEGGRGGVAPGPYAGADGEGEGECVGVQSGGGGGGSIGATAAADLAVAMRTFQAGSGGGGGGPSPAGGAGSGGGGGGGALRIASGTRIRVTGALLASGGAGGGPASTAASGGGGGSGGIIFLSAPELHIGGKAVLDVDGGAAGFIAGASGGRGGLGRIRISTDPDACMIGGDFGDVARPTGYCELTPVPVPGAVYIGRYPE